ncbi:TonB family protein [Asticcacaulis sp. DW145]|uniref:energy transducer TonB family protein n=1 Tax=Asticcacaulis sp. DW145 TaxID=3095608 RepID=UPI0030920B34|nr:TonB family protein [Asticcacaulis sp. DW145]
MGASVLVNGGFLLAVAGLAPQPTPPPVESPVFEVAMEVRPAVAKTAPPAAEIQTPPSADIKPSENPVKTAVSTSQPSSSSALAAAMPSAQAVPASARTEPAAAPPSAGAPAAAASTSPLAAAGASRPSEVQAPPPAAYAARLRHHIEQFKIYPPQAKRRRVEGEVVLSFQMDRQGRVLTSRIERGSGSADIDRAALAMLNEAQPLPRPPDSLTGEVLSLNVTTRFSLKD